MARWKLSFLPPNHPQPGHKTCHCKQKLNYSISTYISPTHPASSLNIFSCCKVARITVVKTSTESNTVHMKNEGLSHSCSGLLNFLPTGTHNKSFCDSLKKKKEKHSFNTAQVHGCFRYHSCKKFKSKLPVLTSSLEVKAPFMSNYSLLPRKRGETDTVWTEQITAG